MYTDITEEDFDDMRWISNILRHKCNWVVSKVPAGSRAEKILEICQEETGMDEKRIKKLIGLLYN